MCLSFPQMQLKCNNVDFANIFYSSSSSSFFSGFLLKLQSWISFQYGWLMVLGGRRTLWYAECICDLLRCRANLLFMDSRAQFGSLAELSCDMYDLDHSNVTACLCMMTERRYAENDATAGLYLVVGGLSKASLGSIATKESIPKKYKSKRPTKINITPLAPILKHPVVVPPK